MPPGAGNNINAQAITIELSNVNIPHGPVIDVATNLVQVSFPDSRRDHHNESFIEAKKYYANGQSPIAKIATIGDYMLVLMPK